MQGKRATPAFLQGGVHSIGHDGEGYAFDNEGPRHDVLLQQARIDRALVTNAAWLLPRYWWIAWDSPAEYGGAGGV